jgi:hypothetical protein
MKTKYHEGKQAAENFEQFARAIFQAKKTVVRATVRPKKKQARRKKSGKNEA